jgi:1-acyl-sn-glycerol-3-phosphate acyltransferase
MFSRLLLIIRSIAFYLGYIPITIVISFVFILLLPLLPRRGRYLLATFWCHVILTWLKLTCGVNYEVSGKANLPDFPVVALSNHQSSWETIYFYTLLYPVSPIIKRELTNIPFWGWAIRLLKPIAINRSKPREAGKSLLVQRVARIKEGNSVIVFPEGTRSRPDQVKRFSRGGAKLAVAAQTAILPLAHNAGRCWPPRGFIKYPGTIQVSIGEVIPATGKSADELAIEAESWIRQQVREFAA